MTKPQSMIAAFFCTFIWGTTFIAQDTGMDLIGPYVFNGIRFFVGFLALIPFFLIFEIKKIKSYFILYILILLNMFNFHTIAILSYRLQISHNNFAALSNLPSENILPKDV